MDLVCQRGRGYTWAMNPFLRDEPTPDTAHESARLIGAPTATAALALRLVQVLSDDAGVAVGWCEALQAEGLVTMGEAPADAARLALVLYLARPLPDHLGLLRQLRARNTALPLVVVAQHLRDLDHVLALEMGADDVIDAETGAAVVAARLRALARRQTAGLGMDVGPDRLGFGALSLHLRERRVCLHGSDVALTEGEFEVLWLLASQAGRAVSRAQMLQRLRGLPYQRIDRSIDCRVYRIRAKLGDVDGPLQRIRTVRNCGYLFSPAAW